MKRFAFALLVLVSVVSACGGASWPPKDLKAGAVSAVQPVTDYPVITADNGSSLVQVFSTGQGVPESIRFAPDNRTMIGIGPAGIYVYEDLANPPRVLSAHTDKVTAVRFLPDGKTMISSGLDGKLIFWNMDDWSVASTWEIGGYVDGFDVHPDGDKLVTAGRRMLSTSLRIYIETWDIESRELIREVATIATRDPVQEILYDPIGGGIVLTYGDFYVYNADTGEEVERSTTTPIDLAFNPAQNEFMYATTTGFAVYDTGRWEEQISSSDTRIFEDNQVVRMELFPDGERAMFLLDNGTFEIVSGPFVAENWHVSESWKNIGQTIDIAINADGQVATLNDNGVIRIWDSGFDREQVTGLEPETTEFGALFFSDDSTQLTVIGANGSIQTYDTRSFERLNSIKQDVNWGTHITFSHDRSRFVAQDLGTTTLYSLEDGAEVWSFEDEIFINKRDSFRHLDIEKNGNETFTTATSYANPLTAVFSPDDKYVVVYSFGGMVFYDVQTGDKAVGPIWVREQEIDNLMNVAFTPEGRFLVGGIDPGETFKVWELDKLLTDEAVKPQYGIRIAEDAFFNSIISDGYKAASVTKGGSSSRFTTKVVVWNLLTKEELASVYFNASQMRDIRLAFNPDSSLLAIASDTGEVTLAVVGGSENKFQAHAGKIHAVAFSPDGTLLATAGDDGALRLWAVAG